MKFRNFEITIITSFFNFFFEMSKAEDQPDTGVALTESVFDDNHHERRSWRFCNSRIPRSEVVYFTQVFITIFLIVVFLVKLEFFNLNVKSLYFGFLLFLVQLHILFPTQNYK